MTEMGTSEGLPSGEVLATPALSQGERVIDTFIAPSKTFADILRNQSWWLPFLIVVIIGYGFIVSVEKRVGWEQVMENSMKANPSQAERISNAPAEQQATIRATTLASYKIFSYAFPVFIILYWLVAAAVMLGTLNFGFGGTAKYGQLLAVFVYAGLPGTIKSLLSIIVLYAGLDAEAFQLQNPVGTNLGYYLSPESPKWLMSLGTSIDVFTIWTVVLLVIGCAIVAKIKRGSAAVAVVGWWVLIILISVGVAAFQG
jgi:hypothetical protein